MPRITKMHLKFFPFAEAKDFQRRKRHCVVVQRSEVVRMSQACPKLIVFVPLNQQVCLNLSLSLSVFPAVASFPAVDKQYELLIGGWIDPLIWNHFPRDHFPTNRDEDKKSLKKHPSKRGTIPIPSTSLFFETWFRVILSESIYFSHSQQFPFSGVTWRSPPKQKYSNDRNIWKTDVWQPSAHVKSSILCQPHKPYQPNKTYCKQSVSKSC